MQEKYDVLATSETKDVFLIRKQHSLLYKGQSFQTKYIENQVTSTSNGLFNKILTSFNFSKQT